MVSADPVAIEAWLNGFVRPDAPRGRAAREAAHGLFAALGNPQDRVRAVHVVGTAGKGTVAQLIARELRRRGVTVGLHLSPHVHDVRERFTVADELPSWQEVAAAIEEIDAVIEPGHEPTFFAVTAALAYVLARRANTDVLVVEAGIGGRDDATNTFSRRDVLTVITAIGLDHEDRLGSTVDAIAREKVAVIEGRDWAVVGPQSEPAAQRVIRTSARIHRTRLLDVRSTGDWRTDAAATARAALLWFLPEVGELEPLEQPGRFETHMADGRRWIFDGAHNPMKLEALAGSLAPELRPLVGMLAFGSGKDLTGCAEAIAGALDAAVVMEFGPTEGSFGPRSHPAAEVAAALEAAGVANVSTAGDPVEALELVAAQGAPTVVVTGSFLHLSTVRSALLG